MGIFRFARHFLVTLLVLACTGCTDVPVAQDISQKQANEIVSVLSDSGISARAYKETGGRGRYRVDVDQGNYSFSVSLLTKKGLPGKPRATFEDLVAQRGLIPDSREIEALRVDHAIGVQIEEALENHPAILSARVIVRAKAKNSSGLAPTVSAVVRYREGKEVSKEEVEQIISRAVPGLETDSVYVSLHEAPVETSEVEATGGVFLEEKNVVRVPLVPFLFGWHIPEGEYHSLAIVLVALFLVIAAIGGLVGYWIGYFQNARQVYESDLPELGPPAVGLKIEETKSSLPEV